MVSTCVRARKEEYRVVVRFPKSLRVRCGECWAGVTEFGRACTRCCWPCLGVCCKLCYYLFLALFGIAVFYSVGWILILISFCQKAPVLGLQDVSIRDMVVYQNTTMATTDTPWQVRSDINVNLSAWNPNTVAGCFTTFRRMEVKVVFKGQQILEQEVPLGFGLKPRKRGPVMLDLQGDHFPLKTELGSLLELELRNASAVEFQFYFDVRYMQNDRKAGWKGMACDVTVKTPANANSSQVNSSSADGLVRSSCLQI